MLVLATAFFLILAPPVFGACLGLPSFFWREFLAIEFGSSFPALALAAFLPLLGAAFFGSWPSSLSTSLFLIGALEMGVGSSTPSSLLLLSSRPPPFPAFLPFFLDFLPALPREKVTTNFRCTRRCYYHVMSRSLKIYRYILLNANFIIAISIRPEP